MTWASFQYVAERQVLYLTTIGRRTGLPREIEIWFVVWCEHFYLFAETGEAAGWVKNIRHNPKVTVRIGESQTNATAGVLDRPPTANSRIRLLQSPIANMDGATGCRWKSPRFPDALPIPTPGSSLSRLLERTSWPE
jgi:deazaflavin-dependent oxidoreductase (nitroreductase family)